MGRAPKARIKHRMLTNSRPLVLFGTACVFIALGNSLLLHNRVDDDLSWRPNKGTERRPECERKRSLQDIRKCYPPQLIRDLGEGCNQIDTWPDVQRCLNRPIIMPTKDDDHNGYEIHIIGERNSGTKFVMRELQECFPKNQTYHVHRDFLRAKHWFQPIPPAGESKMDFTRHIVVVVVRDPVEWVAAMHEKPYHSPRHVKFGGAGGDALIPLDWKAFVTKEWTTARSDHDRKLVEDGRVEETRRGDICRQGFSYEQVIPCRFDNSTTTVPLSRLRGFEPIYELQSNGQPFRNILELRSAKLFNFVLEIPLLLNLGGFLVVRYEDLLHEGTRPMLELLAHIVGRGNDPSTPLLPEQCRVGPPQPERLGKRVIPDDFHAWIKHHIDPVPEKLLGYV